MAKPKFNYDSEDFYKEIYALALQGLNDAEIAWALGDNLGVVLDDEGNIIKESETKGLTPDTFAAMKGGSYPLWTPEERERRSARIKKELAHGRAKILGIVRSRYLKAALGGIKVKGHVTRRRYNIIKGIKDEDNMVVEEVNSEQETAPNMQALANFLYHHDPQFRNIQRGLDEAEADIKVNNGVSIRSWIERENEIEKENQE